MKIQITFVLLLFFSFGAFAQNVTQEDIDKKIKPLSEKVEKLQSENSKLKYESSSIKYENRKLKSEIDTLHSVVSMLKENIEDLKSQTQKNKDAISQTEKELGTQIQETGDKNEGKIKDVSESLGKNTLYGIIGVLSAILLSGLLYWLLSKRQKTDKTDFADQLNKTKSSIEESLVKEFGKQTELMDSQLHLIEQQKATLQETPNAEIDHTLALKLCSQINVMENNLNRMDKNVKGVKQIRKSIETLKDNLSANGYEMPELLGKPFHQGMKVIIASSIPDENLEKDSEIISKVLIPQVNYNDKMIQTAQIEVSVGY